MKLTILKSKAGVTILEGVIALGLLALVMAGSFGVLLSSSRQTMQPDIYEEIGFASEKATETLKEYVTALEGSGLEAKVRQYRTRGNDPLKNYATSVCGTGTNDLLCLLPPICNVKGSSFSYTLEGAPTNWPDPADGIIQWEGKGNPQMYQNGALARDTMEYTSNPALGVRLDIACNDYKLGDNDNGN